MHSWCVGLGGSIAADMVRMRLTANGVIAHDSAWESGVGCPAFESFNDAVQWCEAHFMKVRALTHFLRIFLMYRPKKHEHYLLVHGALSPSFCLCFLAYPLMCRTRGARKRKSGCFCPTGFSS